MAVAKYLTTKISLLPLEGTIINELKEAGSEEIVTIVATIHDCITHEYQKLATIGIAMKHLCTINLTRFSKVEYRNNKNMLIAVDKDTVNKIYTYLNTCSWTDWWVYHELGPCEKIELELI
jgi:hypothetical protein